MTDSAPEPGSIEHLVSVAAGLRCPTCAALGLTVVASGLGSWPETPSRPLWLVCRTPSERDGDALTGCHVHPLPCDSCFQHPGQRDAPIACERCGAGQPPAPPSRPSVHLVGGPTGWWTCSEHGRQWPAGTPLPDAHRCPECIAKRSAQALPNLGTPWGTREQFEAARDALTAARDDLTTSAQPDASAHPCRACRRYLHGQCLDLGAERTLTGLDPVCDCWCRFTPSPPPAPAAGDSSSTTSPAEPEKAYGDVSSDLAVAYLRGSFSPSAVLHLPREREPGPSAWPLVLSVVSLVLALAALVMAWPT